MHLRDWRQPGYDAPVRLGRTTGLLWLVLALIVIVPATGLAKAKPKPKSKVTQPATAPAGAAPAADAAKAESAASGSSDTAATPGANTPSLTDVKVAVLELSAMGLSSAMRNNLERLLRNSIATMDGFAVIPPVDVQMALQDPKNKDVAECSGGPECAVAIGRLVGADLVLFGTISTIGEAFSLNLRVMAVVNSKELARERSRTSGNRNLLISELRLAAYRMLAPEKIRGSLLVEIDVEGVSIEIDGKPVGVTPIREPIGRSQAGCARRGAQTAGLLRVSEGVHHPAVRDSQAQARARQVRSAVGR